MNLQRTYMNNIHRAAMKAMTTFTMNRALNSLIIINLAILYVSLSGCGANGEETGEMQKPKKAIVSEEGNKIIIPDGSPGLQQIRTTTVSKGTSTVSVIAPARIVAVISKAETSNDKIVLFDSPDVTSLYSLYRQSKVNGARTKKNLDRIKEMFENQAATGKDVNEAETDAANAGSSMAEMEGKLRALGFNPTELEKVPAGRVWLMSDVTDAQLFEVQKGEEVGIVFSSYPDKEYSGRAEAIGDVIDPVTRTVKVRVAVPNVHGKFLPGMYARVNFGDPMKSVISVPLSSVVTVDSKDFVFVETAPGEYHRREVTTMNSSAKEVVITKGLNDQEKVVVTGTMLLKGLSFGY